MRYRRHHQQWRAVAGGGGGGAYSRSKSNTYRYILRPFDRAAELLRTYLPDRILEITGDHADLRITEEEIATVNRRLMENDVVILGLAPVGQSLEQSFMELTGGGNVIG